MRYSDERATNLFARLFSYAPRPAPDATDGLRHRQRNALEDFCTEALAWCLINSKPFAERLFALDCFASLGFRPDGFQVDTQQSFTGDEDEEEEDEPAPSRSRFDLMITSSKPSAFLVVIECKVAPDKPENISEQLTVYRDRANGKAFQSYAQKRFILLTPYAEKHGADSHLSWDQVHDVLLEIVQEGKDSQAAVLSQFAAFLKLKHLAKMKVPKTSTLLSSLKAVAPLLAGWNAIFASLRNAEVGKAIFGPRDVLPNMDFHTETNGDHYWYGIWSRGPRPTYFVGFHAACSGDQTLYLSVQVAIDGDRRSEKPPKALGDFAADLEDSATNFTFTTAIDAGLDGNAGAIEAWIIERLRGIEEWLKNLAAKGKT